MRNRAARTADKVLQALADGSTWLLFKGSGVRC
jgi:hypothetical protein